MTSRLSFCVLLPDVNIQSSRFQMNIPVDHSSFIAREKLKYLSDALFTLKWFSYEKFRKLSNWKSSGHLHRDTLVVTAKNSRRLNYTFSNIFLTVFEIFSHFSNQLQWTLFYAKRPLSIWIFSRVFLFSAFLFHFVPVEYLIYI